MMAAKFGVAAVTLFPSPLEGEGGECGAIASASRERGNLQTTSAPLSRPRSDPLRSGTLSLKGRGEESTTLGHGQRLALAQIGNHIGDMAFARGASWRDKIGDENSLRESFWRKLRPVVAQIPFAEDLLAAYYCAFDRNTPLAVKATLLGALAYFVLPADAIPDYIPLVGFTDDAAVLAVAVKMVSDHLTPAHRQAAREKLGSY
jgi:uncharacterized membrane protein YkvA (DUF1232 family)